MSGKKALVVLSVLALLTACGQKEKSNETPDSDYQRRLIERLINAQSDLLIETREGLNVERESIAQVTTTCRRFG